MMDRFFLRDHFSSLGFEFDEDTIQRFVTYAEFLKEYNKKINLTAITSDEGIATLHFEDSLQLLKYLPEKGSNVDIGTGAGFPGMPLMIADPTIDFTLLDSLQKRLTFLSDLSERIGLFPKLVHSRGEDAGHSLLREGFDFVTARAVADMRVLAEYCLPLVTVGGVFAPMKSGNIEEELHRAENAITVLGGKIERVEHYTLSDGSERAIPFIKKVFPTPDDYPRSSKKIKKSPL